MVRSPDDLMAAVHKVSPEIADAREVAALIESFGYNDRSMKDFGFPDVFSLAEHIYIRFPKSVAPAEVTPSRPLAVRIWSELKNLARKSSLGLAYSIPWMVLLTLQYRYPDALQVSPELGGALSLSLIASLITTGGFIQMISRSGAFYYGLEEPFLARRSCIAVLTLGVMSVLVFALLGIAVGFYFHVFAGTYLLLAAVNYIGLSLLWMFCAVLSVQGAGWCTPLIFLISGSSIAYLHSQAHSPASLLLMLWPPLAVLCAMGCVVVGFHTTERKNPNAKNSARPRFSVALITMAPFFLYGTVYFGFMFADRLTAGSAIPWVSGLSFGIDSAYTKGMDLVLLAFLITAAVVEYFSDSFLRFWHRLAKQLPQARTGDLVSRLRKRHLTIIGMIVVFFGLICLASWLIFVRAFGLVPSDRLMQTAIMGGIGYLLLSIALLENIILASINDTPSALRAVAVGLGVNLVVGYALSHMLGVEYAAVGLLVGAAVLLWKSGLSVHRALQHPDYHYSVS